MNTRKILILLLLCILNSTPVWAAQNPFVSGKRKSSRATAQESKPPTVLQKALAKITVWQRALRRRLTVFGKEIREHPYGKAFWLFLFSAFLYGALHALGPGHGKSIVISYFLSRPGHYLDGIVMGHVLTFVHVFSAVVVVLSVHFLLTVTGLTAFDTASRHLGQVSYGLLILLGLFLLGKSLYDLKRGGFQQAEEAPPARTDRKHLIATACITGVIPCPGAALILMFTISQQIVIAGLAAMLCVAAGMGLTTTLFALATILSRKTLFHITAGRPKLIVLSHTILSISGAVLIASLGVLLLLGEG